MAQSSLKRGGLLVCLAATLTLMTAPAEARWLRRGLLPGLIGGLALGALAGAAHANQPDELVVIEIPDEPDLVEGVPIKRTSRAERAREKQISRRTAPAARVAAVPQKAQPRRVEIARAPSPTLERCREAITTNTKRFGSTDVKVASVGSEERQVDGGTVAQLNARVTYNQRGRNQVRQARITCQLNTGGEVVAIR